MSSMLVPYAAASASLVRRRLRLELSEEFPEDVVDAAALVVSELVGNAVRHGLALPGGGLLARWDRITDGVRLEVLDGGHAPVTPRPPAPPDSEGGRGLELVAALTSSWGSCEALSGTTVWAQLTGPHGR